jgi:hypothetical protein
LYLANYHKSAHTDRYSAIYSTQETFHYSSFYTKLEFSQEHICFKNRPFYYFAATSSSLNLTIHTLRIIKIAVRLLEKVNQLPAAFDTTHWHIEYMSTRIFDNQPQLARSPSLTRDQSSKSLHIFIRAFSSSTPSSNDFT